ncbi:MAG: cyclase family protein [Solirubrobacterales bacterium]
MPEVGRGALGLDLLLGAADIVDLSLPLDVDLPGTWPGHMPYRHIVDRWYEEAHEADAPGPPGGPQARGYYTAWLTIDEHTGTHVDAPIHNSPPTGADEVAAGAVDRIPLAQLVGPARVIDATDLGPAATGESPLVGAPAVLEHEERWGEIGAGEIVLLRTGWDSRYLPGEEGRGYVEDPKVRGEGPGWAAPGVDCVELLAARGVRCLGTDAPTVGPLQDPVPTHRRGFGLGMVFVEGLARLGRLPARGAAFVCLPLKVVGGSGAPARAAAFLPAGESS